ncbi:MAG: AsmA family protein [Litoreibacter sp.]|nr:AsmA family protein [Litoreibacter sp.]
MRWIVRALGAVVVLIVVAIGAVLLIPAERIARIAETQFEDNTGRALSITGGVSPTLWPRLGVVLEGVSIANADWAGAEPMVEAGAINVAVGAAALMGGDVVVEAFEVDAPVIRLIRGEDGRANWDFLTALGGDETPSDRPSSINSVSLPKGTITGGTIVFEDGVSGQSYRLEALDASVSLDDLAGAAQVDISALMAGQSLSLSASVDALQTLLDGEIGALEATATLGENAVGFGGAAGMEPAQAKGDVTVSLRDYDALFAVIGGTKPRIPEGLGQRVELAGALTYTDAAEVFLRDATVQLDQNRLAGDVDVALGGDKPVVVARLVGDVLDFSAMSTDDTSGDGAANAGAGGWSDARLDVSGLSAVDGQFTFRANAVDLGSIQLSQTQIRGTLDRSRMVLQFERLEAFDGAVTGQFVVNNRNGLSVGGDMQARGVAMQRLLNDFAGFDRLVADAALDLKFLGVGSTMNEIMNSLSGSGRMDLGAGELLGLDIGGMIRNLDASFEGEGSKTVFDDITASFAMDGGVLRNEDLNFVAQLATATGAGSVDLGGQSIDYRLIPVALRSENSSGISVPVLITGPWSDIRFRPDLKYLADQELEEQKAKLKAEAKAREAELKARARAKEDELKESAKDKIEDAAKDALRKLFD